jgi:hypothetical protein
MKRTASPEGLARASKDEDGKEGAKVHGQSVGEKQARIVGLMYQSQPNNGELHSAAVANSD